MSRDLDPGERAGLRETRPHEVARGPDSVVALSREREAVAERGCIYQVSAAERATLAEVGRFRTIALADLCRYRYAGRRDFFEEDLQRLLDQGLLERRTAWNGRRSLTVAVLTRRGQGLVEHHGDLPAGQRVYSGFVKPAEVHHDAAIYRMYQAERAHLHSAGGQVRRVVLDYELKRQAYSPLAKAKGLPPLEYARRQAEIAQKNGLQVVRGKMLLPDLRIEYVTRSGDPARVDLELATEHYRPGMMRGKAQAGFKIYAAQGSEVGRTAPFDPEFAAQIFAF
jgi:hypothetical protein